MCRHSLQKIQAQAAAVIPSTFEGMSYRRQMSSKVSEKEPAKAVAKVMTKALAKEPATRLR
jgi:hypothetical protein